MDHDYGLTSALVRAQTLSLVLPVNDAWKNRIMDEKQYFKTNVLAVQNPNFTELVIFHVDEGAAYLEQQVEHPSDFSLPPDTDITAYFLPANWGAYRFASATMWHLMASQLHLAQGNKSMALESMGSAYQDAAHSLEAGSGFSTNVLDRDATAKLLILGQRNPAPGFRSLLGAALTYDHRQLRSVEGPIGRDPLINVLSHYRG